MGIRAKAGMMFVYELTGCRLTDHLVNGTWVTVKVDRYQHNLIAPRSQPPAHDV